MDAIPLSNRGAPLPSGPQTPRRKSSADLSAQAEALAKKMEQLFEQVEQITPEIQTDRSRVEKIQTLVAEIAQIDRNLKSMQAALGEQGARPQPATRTACRELEKLLMQKKYELDQLRAERNLDASLTELPLRALKANLTDKKAALKELQVKRDKLTEELQSRKDALGTVKQHKRDLEKRIEKRKSHIADRTMSEVQRRADREILLRDESDRDAASARLERLKQVTIPWDEYLLDVNALEIDTIEREITNIVALRKALLFDSPQNKQKARAQYQSAVEETARAHHVRKEVLDKLIQFKIGMESVGSLVLGQELVKENASEIQKNEDVWANLQSLYAHPADIDKRKAVLTMLDEHCRAHARPFFQRQQTEGLLRTRSGRSEDEFGNTFASKEAIIADLADYRLLILKKMQKEYPQIQEIVDDLPGIIELQTELSQTARTLCDQKSELITHLAARKGKAHKAAQLARMYAKRLEPGRVKHYLRERASYMRDIDLYQKQLELIALQSKMVSDKTDILWGSASLASKEGELAKLQRAIARLTRKIKSLS